MKLIKNHKPKSYSELEILIEYHYLNECYCGVKSTGTVFDFGKNLYEAQMEFWHEYKFTLKECIEWEYNLFIYNSLKGSKMENKAKFEIKKRLSTEYIVEKTDQITDEEYRVDIWIHKNNKIILGIQVKPKTYKYMRNEVKFSNINRNKKFKYPVKYLYYDNDKNFDNISEVLKEII